MPYPGADTPPQNMPLKIGSIINASYVQAFVQYQNPHTTGELQTASLETYSGTILLNLAENSGTLQRFHCSVLVPMQDTTIRSYGIDDNSPNPFEAAVCVSLAATSPNGEHVAINAIDQGSVGLINQQFDGINHEQVVLVLDFDIGYRWTTLIRAAYTITLLTIVTGPTPPPIPTLDPNTLPTPT
jgi:hypothetical protein